MILGDLTRDDLPDTLVLMACRSVVEARRSGSACLALRPDLSAIVWANVDAAARFGIAPGPQREGGCALADDIAAALDPAAMAGVLHRGASAGSAFKAERLAIGDKGRTLVLVSFEAAGAQGSGHEAQRALADIGDQPIAIWTSDRSWFDAGFGETRQVYMEDLYDLKDGEALFDGAFLPGGEPIGLMKLTRRMIAVWRRDRGGFAVFDLAGDGGTGDDAAAPRADADRAEDAMVHRDAALQAPPAGAPRGHDESNHDDPGHDDPGHDDPGHDGPRQDDPGRNEASFAHEIEALKSVGGSLLTAAGAALGGAVLERIAGDRDRDGNAPSRSEAGADDAATAAMADVEPVPGDRDGSARGTADPARGPEADNAPQPGSPSGEGASETALRVPPIMAFLGAGIGAAAAFAFAQKEAGASGEGAGETDVDPAADRSPGPLDADPVAGDPAPSRTRSNWGSTPVSVPAPKTAEDGPANGSGPDRASACDDAGTVEDTGRAGAGEFRLATAGDFNRPVTRPDGIVSDGIVSDEIGSDWIEPDGADRADTAVVSDEDGPAVNFRPDLDGEPARFVWRLDHEGRFQTLSPELSETVGPRAADVIGVHFADMADAFDLDPSGEVAELLARRDTWSDRTVFWPVEGTDRRIPIDLAALPVYSRDRSFDGFRGFGVARPRDGESDPNAFGQMLASGRTVREIVADAAVATADDLSAFAAEAAAPGDGDGVGAAFTSSDPAEGPDAGHGSGEDRDGVVRLSQRRRRRDALLSADEAAAFRTIGVALSGATGNEKLESAIQTAKQKIALFGGKLPAASPEPGQSGDRDEVRDESAAGTGASARLDARVAADLVAYYGRLPVPILVQNGDRTVYTNDEFADLTGYRDAGALSAAGGLDHLFDESAAGEGVRLRRANGKTIDVRARMQRIVMQARSFLVISFFATPRLTVAGLGETSRDAVPAEGEPAVKADAARLSTLAASVETAGSAVLLLDPEGRVEAANARASSLFAETNAPADGTGRAPPLGRAFTDLFESTSRERARDLVRAAASEGEAASGTAAFDLDVRGREGAVKLLAAMAEPLETGGWCVILRDRAGADAATERAGGGNDRIDAGRAEDESLRKTHFLAAVAHEIRTPMTAILGFSDAIESEAFGPIGNPRYLDYISDIKRSGRHVLDLVNDLLDLSKAESGKLELDFGAVALNQVAGEVVSMMQPVAGSARIVLRSNLPPSVPPVIADARSIRQIITNLIQNAISYTPTGGQIILSSQYREDGGVTLKCRDNGVGMSETELEIAKSPYGRVKNAGGRGSVGTGLGLPLAHAMAEANGAELVIESSPHGGTVVELRFAPEQVIAD
ncbi:histidine kinase dimerization/phospho-acceptor domain-containing protein [Fulvimarina sp. 2208YS6-2-32]|uniref:histidine kinase n=1 Tax=Fulvimarina uroteuthidis TaxID=3098149 RepID=A0ABU5I1K7_9HYPH|nr:ATP-binding protein [Fulvimarina sp. 2208YS6-2-32]MDY8108699.1 histidine kinase dimerization/phospho-acceptor domain-containing protein [Fulvimarina sp. 2208YS6-2-32]